MKIFVISLQSSTARREHIRRQLDPLGVDYAFFDAVEGAIGYHFFDPHDEDQFLLNTGRRALNGEVGCYASHLALWKRCLEMNQPILIMEDDATIQSHFRAALSETSRLIMQYGFIRLQHGLPKRGLKGIPVETADIFSLHFCQRYPFGAMCYAIAPSTAAAFVDGSRKMTGPVDLFIKKFWEHRQPLFFMFPPAVDGDSIHRSTTIVGDRKRERPRLRIRLNRILNKARVFKARARFNSQYRAEISQRQDRPQLQSRIIETPTRR
jgi:glycosyl transferase family 25